MIELRLPLPPSGNNLFRNVPGKGRVRTERYKIWARAAGNEILAQLARAETRQISGTVELYMGITWPDRRRRDTSNAVKPVEDLLVEHGIIVDDQFIWRHILVRLGVDKSRAGVVVQVKPYLSRAA